MASYASVRQVLQPKCTKYSQFQLSPSWVVPCSLVFKTKYISRFSRLHEFSSHRNLTAASKATSGNDAKEDEDGVSLGTMKLPLDIDIPRFESLLFQLWKYKPSSAYDTKRKIHVRFLRRSLLGGDSGDDNSRSSSEYQTCNVSDFYISDMIAAGLPIEGNSIYDDIAEVSCLLDYKCDEPTTFFDVAEEYMILPFLGDTTEVGGNHDGCEDTIIDSDDSSLYLAIHQLRSCNEEPDVNPYSDSDQLECFDPHKFIRNLPDLPNVAPKFHPTTLLNESQKMKSTTLVLDLDEFSSFLFIFL
ncbi:hypothetical protein LOK49_Contig206G00001 [Camellia lanceoleosa]|nr:hypothetical protein LOK49_Contig206G00001 [Camellia lanceoleosa]